jgi:DNA-binding transcriptional ArsR family regulator
MSKSSPHVKIFSKNLRFTRERVILLLINPNLMIDSLVTSQTRIKLLKKFFLNSSTKAHLRGLESEFGESSNAIRVELNRFEDAGLLHSLRDGNKKVYQANSKHPLYKDIHSIIMKETGIDRVIEKVIHRLGNLLCVYLTGDFAHGMDSQVIELILVGADIDREYLARKVVQAEELVGRKVSYIVLEPEEAKDHLSYLKPADLLPLWDCNEHGI